jgi:cytoskeleton protein RodZ
MTEENNNSDIDTVTAETNLLDSVASTPPVIEKQITIGQYLKQRREEKGLSLKVISQQTKIHIGLLENLEADSYDKLPSKTYVRGFVKSTTKILNLDQDHALKLLDTAYESRTPSTPISAATTKEMKTETARNTLSAMAETPLETVRSMTMSSTAFIAKSVIFLGIIILVAFNVKSFFEKSNNETESRLPEVISTLDRKKAAPKKIVPKPAVVEPKVEDPIQVNIIQDKTPKVDVTVNNIKLQTISLGDKQLAEISLPQEKYNEYLPAKYRVQPTPGVETLFLNAVEGDAWLTYKVDDKEIKKFVLRQGRTLFLSGSLIRLFVGNTRSLKAFHNNKAVDLSVNSKTGVKNIVLPEEMKTKYIAPLFVYLEDGSAMTSDEYLKSNDPRKLRPIPVIPAKKPTPPNTPTSDAATTPAPAAQPATPPTTPTNP